MKRLAASMACLLMSGGAAIADNVAYSGPFYMCPDARGEEQKSLFQVIDITNVPMRIEAWGSAA